MKLQNMDFSPSALQHANVGIATPNDFLIAYLTAGCAFTLITMFWVFAFFMGIPG
jgi:hypothetical protein